MSDYTLFLIDQQSKSIKSVEPNMDAVTRELKRARRQTKMDIDDYDSLCCAGKHETAMDRISISLAYELELINVLNLVRKYGSKR